MRGGRIRAIRKITATKLSEFTLSCETYVEEELIEDIDLAMSASGQVFVVSPVMQRLRVFDADQATGALTSGTAALLGWTPTDVAVGPGPSSDEVAVVVGYDPGTGEGKATVFNDTSNLSNNTPVNLGEAGPGPLVSVAIRFNGEFAYLADQGNAVVHTISVPTQSGMPGLAGDSMPTPGTIRRLVVQRRLP